MAVVVPHSQQLTLAWTPPAPASDAMKKSDVSSPVHAENKKHRHNDGEEDEEAVKNENGENSPQNSSPDEYKNWPTLARKRQRMTEEERKARHREVQRQFMQRKLAKLDEMRKLMALLEKQFQLLQLSQERARLEHENEYLHRRVQATPTHWSHEQPHELLRHAPPLAHAPVHSHSRPHRPHTGMLPWDEILEAVSEANV